MMKANGKRIQGSTNDNDRDWFINYLSFDHGEDCEPIATNLQKVFQYKVAAPVLAAADSLSKLAAKWWGIVKDNDLNDSILNVLDDKDKRFYGVFFLELPCYIPGAPEDQFYTSFQDEDTRPQDEIKALNTFYALTTPSKEDILQIQKLVILLLEDIKFVRKIHKYFQHDQQNRLYLANIGFLAGGEKAQKLHLDCEGLNPTDRSPTVPFSVMIPIGKDGRSIHINSIHRSHDKYHINRGYGVIFDGNVPHAGAKSKSPQKLNNLALHIHIDRLGDCRKPNILDLVNDVNVDVAYSSSEEDGNKKRPASTR